MSSKPEGSKILKESESTLLVSLLKKTTTDFRQYLHLTEPVTSPASTKNGKSSLENAVKKHGPCRNCPISNDTEQGDAVLSSKSSSQLGASAQQSEEALFDKVYNLASSSKVSDTSEADSKHIGVYEFQTSHQSKPSSSSDASKLPGKRVNVETRASKTGPCRVSECCLFDGEENPNYVSDYTKPPQVPVNYSILKKKIRKIPLDGANYTPRPIQQQKHGDIYADATKEQLVSSIKDDECCGVRNTITDERKQSSPVDLSVSESHHGIEIIPQENTSTLPLVESRALIDELVTKAMDLGANMNFTFNEEAFPSEIIEIKPEISESVIIQTLAPTENEFTEFIRTDPSLTSLRPRRPVTDFHLQNPPLRSDPASDEENISDQPQKAEISEQPCIQVNVCDQYVSPQSQIQETSANVNRYPCNEQKHDAETQFDTDCPIRSERSSNCSDYSPFKDLLRDEVKELNFSQKRYKKVAKVLMLLNLFLLLGVVGSCAYIGLPIECHFSPEL